MPLGTPLIDYSVWATWQALYDLDAEPDGPPPGGDRFRPHVRLSYHRATMLTLAREMAQACVDILGWLPTKKIVVAGCGFGWMVERLQVEHGFTRIIGIDTSMFIQTNKANTEEADIDAAIAAVGLTPTVGEGATVKARLFDGGPRGRAPVLNEDGQSNPSRVRIRQALSGPGGIDIAMTEHVLESWADADCLQISAVMHQLAPIVQHFVMPIDPARVIEAFRGGNWKPTLQAWKALLPADTFITAGDYQVL